MMSKHNFQEYKTPSQTAAILGISVPTLRKYSLMIEKATSDGYFERNQQNTRLYRQTDISQLQELAAISKQPDMTLKDAIAQLYGMTTSSPMTEPLAKDSGVIKASANQSAPVEQFMQMLMTMQETITSQKKAIDDLHEQLKTIQAQNAQILKQLPATSDAALGLNSTSEHQDHMSTLSEVTDHTNSAKHTDGSLTKTEESELKTYITPHTLVDMQVGMTPKKHWWQRILN